MVSNGELTLLLLIILLLLFYIGSSMPELHNYQARYINRALYET